MKTKPENTEWVHLHQFLYTLDPQTGEVYQYTAKLIRPIKDEATLARVYAAHFREYPDHSKVRAFNGHEYIQAHGLTINLMTGSIVTNGQISNRFLEPA